MRILFLTTTHNSLSQRAFVELTDRGHDVAVALASSGDAMLEAAYHYQPDMILAPMLKRAISEQIWRRYPCIIVHPGIKGDRGPSSLDWAIQTGARTWGVTLLEAIAEMDAGPIWASHCFPMRPASKSSLYRHDVTEAAIQGILETVERIEDGNFVPEPLDYRRADVHGCLHPPMKQADRLIDWSADTTALIARKIWAADSMPGVLDTLLGEEYFLYGAHEEDHLMGPPGAILAQRNGAICRGTVDGAIWISHLKERKKGDHQSIKLPATMVLGARVKDVPVSTEAPVRGRSFREIRYEERKGVGYLHFDFYNGAMSTDQCRRLRAVFLQARKRPTRVIVLMGGCDFWSNGIHLNVIEAAEDPAGESWRNINAMNDLVYEILTTTSHLVVSAIQGNAGAGGVMLALAADYVYARSGVVLNPHYKSMGLYGSEYWTYSLPRRVGTFQAQELTESCRPIGTRAACSIGLIDAAFGADLPSFREQVIARAEQFAVYRHLPSLLDNKYRQRQHDERHKPLAEYRSEELSRMWINFHDLAYHEARRRFVLKLPSTQPPALVVQPELAELELLPT